MHDASHPASKAPRTQVFSVDTYNPLASEIVGESTAAQGDGASPAGLASSDQAVAGDDRSQTVTLIAQQHRLSQQLQQVRQAQETLAIDIKQRVLWLREHVETRRQHLRLLAEERDRARKPGNGEEPSSESDYLSEAVHDSEPGWSASDDPLQELSQGVRLVELYHQELDRWQRLQEGDADAAVVREQALVDELESARRHGERISGTVDLREKELAETQNQYEEVRSQASEVVEELEAARQLHTQLRDAIARLEEENQQLAESREELEQISADRIEKLTSQLSQVQRDHHQLREEQLAGQQRCESLEADLIDSRGQRDELQQEHDDLRQSHEQMLERMHAEITLRESADQQIASLETSVAGLEEDVKAAAESRQCLERQFSEKAAQLQTELTREQTLRGNLQTGLKETQDRLADCRKELSSEQDHVQSARDDAARLETALAALEENYRALENEGERNSRVMSAAIDNQHKQLSQMTAERDGGRRELTALKEQLEQAREQHEASKKGWQAAFRKVRDETKQVCSKVQQRRRSTEADLEAMRNKHRGMVEQCQQLEEEKNELSAERTHLKLSLAAAETPALSRRIVKPDGTQLRIDGPQDGQHGHIQIRLSDLYKRKQREAEEQAR